jgi:hypothetical protein
LLSQLDDGVKVRKTVELALGGAGKAGVLAPGQGENRAGMGKEFPASAESLA